jgi:hypothetical protein
MVSLDLQSLPRGPLSMAGLVAIEPAPLRRLLKSGLRRGISSADLSDLLEQDWQWSWDSPQAQGLLTALQERGWFCCEGDLWKTRLGP